jgi:glycosyltransferase involved in cell wall biosynthesis
MRILLLNYEFPPMGGGAGRATYNIARQLARLGHDVDVLTSRFNGQKSFEIIDGVSVYRVPIIRESIHECGFSGAFAWTFLAYLQLLRLVSKKEYDILHYFFGLPTGILAILPARHQNIPFIVSLRGSDVPSYDPYNKKLDIAHRILKPLTQTIWRKARRIVALSDSLRSTALKTSPWERIDVIGNGINSDIFLATESRSDEKTFKMIMVSRLIERKGIQHVIAAISRLQDPDISLTIVGTGNYECRLRKMVEEYGLQSSISFFGYCPNEMLPSLYNNSDVFILTSLAESFGIVFLEAMASGLPIIAGRTGGVPAIVSEENGILVDPGSVPEIMNAIIEMKNNPKKRKEMAIRNRKKAMEQYSWQKVAEMYQEIYRNPVPSLL